ncbi:MAG: hypothetical protein J0H57_19740, partial [Rhodospirillales bacterium]|nr:hypothetical protein [Rhodospirillales bacterium]
MSSSPPRAPAGASPVTGLGRVAARLALVAVAAGLLAGCSLGPDYRRPDQEIPAAYRASAATEAQAW